MKQLLNLFIITVILFKSIIIVKGIDYHFSPPPLSYDFYTNTNWDPVGIPSENDNVFFDQTDSPAFSIYDVYVNNMTISNGNEFLIYNDKYCIVKEYLGILSSNSILSLAPNSGVVAPNIENRGVISSSSGFIQNSNVTNYRVIRTGIDSTDSVLYILESVINIEPQAILASFNHSSIFIFSSNTTLRDGYIWAENNSTVLVQKGIFNVYGTSYVAVINSKLYLNDSQIIMNDNSYISTTDNGLSLLIGKLKSYNTSNIWLDTQSRLFIQGELELNDKSYLHSKNSTINVNGILTNKDSSFVNVYDHSEFYVFGYAHFEPNSYFTSANSHVLITGRLNMNGNFFDNSGTLFVDGIFDFNKYGFFNNSQLIVNGNMHIFGHLEGVNSLIGVVGNLTAHPNSNIDCTECIIIVMNGNFYVSSSANLKLINSSLVNSNGTYISFGDTYIQEGSTFVNKASMVLDSNVYLSDNQTLSDLVFIDNQGLLTINGQKQNINVPLYNNGTIKTAKNDIFMYKYTQTDGQFMMNGGSITYKETMDLLGGLLNGNGTINGAVSNKGSIFSDDKQVNQLSINGAYTQSSNGSLTMTINSLESFSQLNISNDANLGGTLIIRISTDLINQANGTEINLVNFQNKTGSFSSVQFNYFNPTTQQDAPPPSNECKQVSSGSNSRSFSVLITDNCNNVNVGSGKKLAGGAIAGIVIGCIAAVVIVGVSLHYRQRLSRFLSLKKEKVSNRMRTLSKSRKT